MLSHVQAWRSCYFWVFSLWVNSRKECIILGFGQAWTPTSTDPRIPSPKERVEAWSFRKYSEWSSFPGVGCLPSAVRQYGLFPPLSSSYSSSAFTSMFHCLSSLYYPWFRCRAFSCSWGWLWSTCLVHFAWWITVWMPLWSNANLSFSRVRSFCDVHQGAPHDWGRSCHHHSLEADHNTGAEGGFNLEPGYLHSI